MSDWCQKDERIREELEKIFFIKESEEPKSNYHNYNNEYYGTGKKASLYFKDSNKHIFAEIILDATASLKEDYANSVLVIETVNRLIKKVKMNTHDELREVPLYNYEEDVLIPIYDRNLDGIF